MHKGFLRTAAILAAITVALGAFGAHGLIEKVSAETLEIFKTGVQYQFYHVLALALAGILYREFPAKGIRIAGICFIAGIVFFSGSLYLLTWVKYAGAEGFRWVGPVTPFGGLLFISGWICLAAGIGRNRIEVKQR